MQSRLERRFDLLTESIPIGPLQVTFTRVTNPDTVLNELCDRIEAEEKRLGRPIPDDELGLPYWAELWPSAIGVGQWLVRCANRLEQDRRRIRGFEKITPPRALDLGCGMGLAGTVAGMMGYQVMMGDIETACLGFARLNGLRYATEVGVRRIDWQKDQLSRQFDLIIGSDVLYDRNHWLYLDDFFNRHLAPQGRIILGEPGRITGDLWLEWMVDRGWEVEKHVENVPVRDAPIRLFELKRKGHVTSGTG